MTIKEPDQNRASEPLAKRRLTTFAEMPSHGGPTRGADTTAWWPPSRMPLWWWVVSAVLVALVITAVWLVPVLVFDR